MHPAVAVTVGTAVCLLLAFGLPLGTETGQLGGGFLGGVVTGWLADGGVLRDVGLGLVVGVVGGLVVGATLLEAMFANPLWPLLAIGGVLAVGLIVLALGVVAGLGALFGGLIRRSWPR